MVNLLTTLAVLAASVRAAVDISGSGRIIVLNHTEPIPTLENRIGCLDSQGHLVVDDCGVFSNLQDAPQSDSGFGCDWTDESQPENLDSAYGKNSFGYSCWDGANPFIFYPVVSRRNLPGQDQMTANISCSTKIYLFSVMAGSIVPLIYQRLPKETISFQYGSTSGVRSRLE